MKKLLLWLLLIVVFGFIAYQYIWPKPANETPEPAGPLAIDQPTDAFTAIFTESLINYYSLKDAFIKSDAAQVNASSAVFKTSMEAIDMQALNADSSLVMMADQLKQSITAELIALAGETDIEEKRKSFQMVSDQMYDLIRTIRYGGTKIYRQYCPMAFDNSGAYWLSNSAEIINPYFGDAMLHCGEVRDSIYFR